MELQQNLLSDTVYTWDMRHEVPYPRGVLYICNRRIDHHKQGLVLQESNRGLVLHCDNGIQERQRIKCHIILPRKIFLDHGG